MYTEISSDLFDFLNVVTYEQSHLEENLAKGIYARPKWVFIKWLLSKIFVLLFFTIILFITII